MSRRSRQRKTTPHSWISQYRLMRRPLGGDTSKLLVYSGSRAGRDVPNASCGGVTTDVCWSKVTTQLERSEKLRYIGFSFARKEGGSPLATTVADSSLSSSSYRAGKREYAPSNVMTSVNSVKERNRLHQPFVCGTWATRTPPPDIPIGRLRGLSTESNESGWPTWSTIRLMI